MVGRGWGLGFMRVGGLGGGVVVCGVEGWWSLKGEVSWDGESRGGELGV